MLESGTDLESYVTEYTLVYEDIAGPLAGGVAGVSRRVGETSTFGRDVNFLCTSCFTLNASSQLFRTKRILSVPLSSEHGIYKTDSGLGFQVKPFNFSPLRSEAAVH